jgi:exodeoxyribonuclease VII small subunit
MAKKSFEEAMARLEEITAELEDSELSLEKSLKKFDEGIKLAEFCNAQLAEAKAKVEILLEKDGQLEATPFSRVNGGDQTISE